MKNKGIEIIGHKGTWYVISSCVRNGIDYFLLEHELYGEDSPCLIINEEYAIVMEDVENGFDDLDCYIENIGTCCKIVVSKNKLIDTLARDRWGSEEIRIIIDTLDKSEEVKLTE